MSSPRWDVERLPRNLVSRSTEERHWFHTGGWREGGVTQTAVPAPLTRAEFPEGRTGKTGLGRRQSPHRVSFRVSCMISLQDRRCQESAWDSGVVWGLFTRHCLWDPGHPLPPGQTGGNNSCALPGSRGPELSWVSCKHVTAVVNPKHCRHRKYKESSQYSLKNTLSLSAALTKTSVLNMGAVFRGIGKVWP